MKIHEIIGSAQPVHRGKSLTESNAVPAGEAGRAILTEALSKPHQPSGEPLTPKMRLKEFLLLLNQKQAITIDALATRQADDGTRSAHT